MFIKRISDYARGKGIETNVDAISFVDMDAYADNTDILLIGPQARYQYKNMQNKYGDKISVIQVIDMASFGLLKADKVFNEAYIEYTAKTKEQ
jgi:PTS system cellobiose-specific IIB component